MLLLCDGKAHSEWKGEVWKETIPQLPFLFQARIKFQSHLQTKNFQKNKF